MLESIISTLKAMGWLGIVLALLMIVNTVCGAVVNVGTGKEKFSFKRLLGGVGKALIFYMGSAFAGVAFAMLPHINTMIGDVFGMQLFADEMLHSMSSVGILGVVVSVITAQAKRAISSILSLANMGNQTEEITWKVEEE